MVGMDGSKLGS